MAQGTGTAVVQPLPPPAAQSLNTALRRLARNPRNLDALIAAGTASLELGDVDAAVGFFGRADELAPGDPRAKAGKAAAYVRKRRPVEALRLFREAEEGGVEIVRLAADHGLAFDLVGNNREAQAAYRRALSRGESAEVSRRLALSQAIDGNRQGFEQTLRPLLARRDFASYRTRAFGLAILGRADEAVAITEAVMPRNMADQLAPYLRYMPRLTKAQQAAAANLGIYPGAAQIGRDDPRIAGMAGSAASSSTARSADAGLAPSGEPLGTPATGSVAAVPANPDSPAGAQQNRIERLASAARRESASDPLTRSRERPRVVRAVEAAPQRAAEAARNEPVEVEVQDAPASVEPAAQEVVATAAESQPVAALPAQAAVSVQTPEPVSTPPVVVASIEDTSPAPGFDLAQLDQSRSAQQPSAVTSVSDAPSPASTVAQASVAPTATPSTPPAPPAPTPSVLDAFADLAGPVAPPVTAARGAVDISAIEPPREVEEAPEAEPEKPAHPSRFWVQVATGRDRSALRFDWRRISRQAAPLLSDKDPYVTPWGQTNRLLAGPFPSRTAARNALNQMKEKGIDAFTFTSPEGQEIEQLR
ncbi:tetratricopeptide repeat protein [Erythrobacter jejuensis]|uniref:Tetratricopeptide repeat protein n=2 Tax=Parerythrobacter jejuensis TaxID=795812 RepID=A0A845AR41_9SPHN|nr:tetratricopeptide repeat protein [Parerythrobacter jejuensis]